jgi:hypothetical protein
MKRQLSKPKKPNFKTVILAERATATDNSQLRLKSPTFATLVRESDFYGKEKRSEF